MAPDPLHFKSYRFWKDTYERLMDPVVEPAIDLHTKVPLSSLRVRGRPMFAVMLDDDLKFGSEGEPVTIHLPPPKPGQIITIKDEGGTVTVTGLTPKKLEGFEITREKQDCPCGIRRSACEYHQ